MTEMHDLPGELDPVLVAELEIYDDDAMMIIKNVEDRFADYESLDRTEPIDLQAYRMVIEILDGVLITANNPKHKSNLRDSIMLIKRYLNPGRSLR